MGDVRFVQIADLVGPWAKAPVSLRSTAHAKGAIGRLDLVGAALRSGDKTKRTARCFDSNGASRFIRIVDDLSGARSNLSRL